MLANNSLFALPVGVGLLVAQSVSQEVPIVSVPSSCTSDFEAGTDTVLLTVPYSPSQVRSVVDDFKDLTWSGNPPDTVTLNGTDNIPGTARIYNISGLSVIETLSEYYRPALDGCQTPINPKVPPYTVDTAYYEAHTFAQVAFQGVNVYMPFDGLIVTRECGGRASQLNYSSSFCASNATQTTGLLHTLHTQDLAMVQKMLGNATFTSCDALSWCL